jgi:hypothetical protein
MASKEKGPKIKTNDQNPGLITPAWQGYQIN